MASEAEVELIISTADTLPELERELEAIIRTAENNAGDIDVEATIARQESVSNLIDGLEEVIAAAGASADPIELEAQLNRLDTLNDLNDALDDAIIAAEVHAQAIELEAALDADIARLDTEIATLVEELEASAPEVDIEVNIDRDGSGRRGLEGIGRGLGSALPSLGKFGAALPGVGLGVAGLAQTLAGLVGALEQIAPASAVAVPSLIAVTLASGTVKLAMQGVGDAVKTAFDPEAKPEDLAKAMEKLAPNARSFVTELRSMKSAFKEIQQDVQENFFDGFDDALISLSTNVLPQVSTALASTSTILNQMALGAAAAAIELGENGTLQVALLGATEGLANLKGIPGQVVTALGQLGVAAAPAFDRITQGAANAATKISEKLTKAFESGALRDSINTAIDAIVQLGRIFGNIFEGIGNIIGGVTGEAGSLFFALEKITQAFADVTASDGFQQALGALVRTLGVLVDTLLPVVSQALKALGPVFQALEGPLQILIQALGPVLSQIIAALGPVLVSLAQAFGQLVIAVTPILSLAGTLISALLPALIPLFDAVGQTLNALVPFVETLAATLAAELVPLFTTLATDVLPQLLPPLVELSTALIPVLTNVITELAPSLVTLAENLGQVLVAVTPLIVELINLTLALGEELGPVLKPVLGFILDLVNLGLKILSSEITGVVIPIIGILVDLLRGDFSAAWQSTQDLIAAVAGKIGGLIEAMNNKIKSILGDLARAAVDKARELVDGFSREFNRIVSRAQEIISQVPGAVLAGLGHVGSLLVSAGSDMIQGLINGISGKLARVREIAAEVAGAVTGPISKLLDINSPSKVMRDMGHDTMDGFRLGLADELPALETQLRSIAAVVPSFALPGGQTLALPNLGQQGQPQVQVFIGNEEFHGRIDSRIARADIARSRIATQGVRR